MNDLIEDLPLMFGKVISLTFFSCYNPAARFPCPISLDRSHADVFSPAKLLRHAR